MINEEYESVIVECPRKGYHEPPIGEGWEEVDGEFQRTDFLDIRTYRRHKIMTTKYAAGFAFNDNNLLGLIKNRPDWQAGKTSIPGGHCELGEPPLATCIREFYEETGILTGASDWTLFAILKNETFKIQVHFYKTETVDISTAKTMTDEAVFIEDISVFTPPVSLNNIAWLIQMAKSIDADRANYFEINEK